MTTQKEMQVNGQTAKVLSEGFHVTFRGEIGEGRSLCVYQGGESPSRAQRVQYLKDAEAQGFTTVEIGRHLYVTYTLACTMKRRSGALTFTTTFRKNENGVWFSTKTRDSSIY